MADHSGRKSHEGESGFIGRLYHHPWYSSCRVVQVIHELQLQDKIEIKSVQHSDMKTPDYLSRLHPQGKVPVYEEFRADGNNFVLVESSAIVLYLLEKYDKEDKLRAQSKDNSQFRGKFLQWLLYAPASTYYCTSTIYVQKKDVPDDKRNQALLDEKLAEWKTIAPFMERELGDKKFLLGDEFTAADLIVTYDLLAASVLDLLEDYPKLKAYFERLSQRPSFQATYPGLTE